MLCTVYCVQYSAVSPAAHQSISLTSVQGPASRAWSDAASIPQLSSELSNYQLHVLSDHQSDLGPHFSWQIINHPLHQETRAEGQKSLHNFLVLHSFVCSVCVLCTLLQTFTINSTGHNQFISFIDEWVCK